MAESNKKFVSCELDADEHRMLIRLASFLGQHPQSLVTIAVRRFLAEVNPDGKDIPIELKVYQNMIKMRKSFDIEAYLRDMATAYQSAPTEEGSDLLRTTAEMAGYAVDEVLQWIEEDRLVPLGTNPTAMDVSTNFLKQFMKPGEEYPVETITEKALEQGIQKSTLHTAKRKLNIKSVRRSDCWVWIIETQEVK